VRSAIRAGPAQSIPDAVAPSKVNLYIGKTAVKFNIPEAEAVDRLKDLIREWQIGRPCAANRTGSCFGFATLNRLNRKSLVTM
jgi:hypothetical protein